MNGKSKLNQQHKEQSESLQEQSSRQQAGQEFGTVEEMLRFDASQNPVPGNVSERLQDSIEAEDIKPPQPWWKRWFG